MTGKSGMPRTSWISNVRGAEDRKTKISILNEKTKEKDKQMFICYVFQKGALKHKKMTRKIQGKKQQEDRGKMVPPSMADDFAMIKRATNDCKKCKTVRSL